MELRFLYYLILALLVLSVFVAFIIQTAFPREKLLTDLTGQAAFIKPIQILKDPIVTVEETCADAACTYWNYKIDISGLEVKHEDPMQLAIYVSYRGGERFITCGQLGFECDLQANTGKSITITGIILQSDLAPTLNITSANFAGPIGATQKIILNDKYSVIGRLRPTWGSVGGTAADLTGACFAEFIVECKKGIIPQIQAFRFRALGEAQSIDLCDGRITIELPENTSTTAAASCGGKVGYSCRQGKICCATLNSEGGTASGGDGIFVSFWKWPGELNFEKCKAPGRLQIDECKKLFISDKDFGSQLVQNDVSTEPMPAC